MLSNERRAEAGNGFLRGYGATASISARHPRRRADATRPENSHCQLQHAHVALACDWLTTPGGAEKVLLELHHMYPDAPIYTSQYRPKKITWFADADVRTGWLQPFPAALRKILGPLRQLYFSHLDLSHYDLVISVTGAEAKSIRTAPKKGLSSHYSTPFEKSQDINPKKASKIAPEAKKRPNSTPKSNPQPTLASNSAPEASEAPEAQADHPHRAKHLCYCHVPTQYYWQMYDKYLENPGFGPLNPLVRLCFKLLVKPLRKADYAAAQRPDQFVTISDYAAAQIKKYYDRNAVTISPPVETTKFRPSATRDTSAPAEASSSAETYPLPDPDSPSESPDFSTKNPQKSTTFPQLFHKKNTRIPQKPPTFPQQIHKFSTSFPQVFHSQNQTFPQGHHDQPQDIFPQYSYQPNRPDLPPQLVCPHPHQYFIIACRQVTWKRVDLAISACLEAKVPLLVVGDGPERKNLLKIAENSPLIKFLPWVDSSELAFYLQNAKAYLFPSLEPFGIAAVEALAAGCPVIAYAEGGSRDFITPGKNGLLFDSQTPHSLAAAIKDFPNHHFDRVAITASSADFDTSVFREKIQSLVDSTLTPTEPTRKDRHA